MRDAISPHDIRRALVRMGLLKAGVRPAPQPRRTLRAGGLLRYAEEEVSL